MKQYVLKLSEVLRPNKWESFQYLTGAWPQEYVYGVCVFPDLSGPYWRYRYFLVDERGNEKVRRFQYGFQNREAARRHARKHLEHLARRLNKAFCQGVERDTIIYYLRRIHPRQVELGRRLVFGSK